jgi:transposase
MEDDHENAKRFLKKYTSISDVFIDDFFSIYTIRTRPGDYVVDLDVMAKWIGARKDSLYRTLVHSYTKDLDYETIKVPIGGRGRHRQKTTMTPDCFRVFSLYLLGHLFLQNFLIIKKMFKKAYSVNDILRCLTTYNRVKSFRKAASIEKVGKSTINRWWLTFQNVLHRPKIQKRKKRPKSSTKFKGIIEHIKILFIGQQSLKYFSLKTISNSLMLNYPNQKPPSISYVHKCLKKAKISRRRFSTS